MFNGLHTVWEWELVTERHIDSMRIRFADISQMLRVADPRSGARLCEAQHVQSMRMPINRIGMWITNITGGNGGNEERRAKCFVLVVSFCSNSCLKNTSPKVQSGTTDLYTVSTVGCGVAAAILAAVEGGILPPGMATLNEELTAKPPRESAGQDARLYGRRDARRYAKQIRIAGLFSSVPAGRGLSTR